MVLVHLLRSMRVSTVFRSDFLFCCNVGMVFQYDFIVLNDTFLSPHNIRRRFAVFIVVISPFQNEWFCTCALGLSSAFRVLRNTCTAAQLAHVWLHG